MPNRIELCFCMKKGRKLQIICTQGYLLEVLVQNVYNILDCIKEDVSMTGLQDSPDHIGRRI